MKTLESADIVTTVGGGSKLEKAMRLVVVSLGEIQLAVLDLVCALPLGFAPGARRAGIASLRSGQPR